MESLSLLSDSQQIQHIGSKSWIDDQNHSKNKSANFRYQKEVTYFEAGVNL